MVSCFAASLVLFGSHVILHGVTRMHEVSFALRFIADDPTSADSLSLRDGKMPTERRWCFD